jgi:nitrous oxide reductase
MSDPIQNISLTAQPKPQRSTALLFSTQKSVYVVMASSSSDSNIDEILAVGTVVSVDDGAAASEKEVYWEVERVIRQKTIRGGQKHYLIKWKGSDQTTWEPEDNLCDSALEDAERLAAQKEHCKSRKRKKKKEVGFIYIVPTWWIRLFHSLTDFYFLTVITG